MATGRRDVLKNSMVGNQAMEMFLEIPKGILWETVLVMRKGTSLHWISTFI